MSCYFNNRTQLTNISKSCSQGLLIKFGVPQGSILGTLVFIIFIRDLQLISSMNLILFADDTTAFDTNESLDALLSLFKSKFSIIND